MSESKDAAGQQPGSRFELLCGVTIAILAALLAINELGSGKFGGDEIAARNEATKAYSWYGSKSLKENLAEGQRDLLLALRAAGAIAPEKNSAVQGTLDRLDGEMDRYSREKQEILSVPMLWAKTTGPRPWMASSARSAAPNNGMPNPTASTAQATFLIPPPSSSSSASSWARSA